MDWRTAIKIVPSQQDLEMLAADITKDAEAAKAAAASAPLAPAEPEKASPQRMSEQRPVAPKERTLVVIEMVADPKFKANLGSVSEAFREAVSDHREFLRKLVRARDFDRVVEHFRREEQRNPQLAEMRVFRDVRFL
jgi:hypothetical protein